MRALEIQKQRKLGKLSPNANFWEEEKRKTGEKNLSDNIELEKVWNAWELRELDSISFSLYSSTAYSRSTFPWMHHVSDSSWAAHNHRRGKLNHNEGKHTHTSISNEFKGERGHKGCWEEKKLDKSLTVPLDSSQLFAFRIFYSRTPSAEIQTLPPQLLSLSFFFIAWAF